MGVAIQFDGSDFFVVHDDKRVARLHAGTWIPLEPGYTVTRNKDHVEIAHEGTLIEAVHAGWFKDYVEH